ncbi:hypothetical protein NM208_g12088 [Fusarium decemcellulare]|uniref:Uncharacterized protein n=1 Tax=Fusarium decemcellulare TaxID=57161 RepID=A0ACC1RQP5_9HYPO|nr:hypothetical protein NM208_g12088 [Fusarium decemcellulare]
MLNLLNENPCSEGILEIDGLLAGLSYLEKVPLVTDEHARLLFPTTEDHLEHPLQRLDWSSIQDVQLRMLNYWQRLVELPPTIQSPRIMSLFRTYTNPTRLQEAGVFAFRNTLTGLTPNSLEDIFALCSLSYVMSCSMIDEGKFTRHNILAGINVWQNALQNNEDRQTFGFLAEICWPEDPGETTTIAPHGNGAPHPLPHSGPTSESFYALDFSSWSNEEGLFGMTGNTGYGCLPQNIFDSFPSTVTGLVDPFLEIPEDFPQLANTSAGTNHAEETNMMGAEGGQITIDSDDVQKTAVITNIRRFLDKCNTLMRLLSGGGVTAKGLQSTLTFNQQRFELKNHIKNAYLWLLRDEKPFTGGISAAILSVAERFVDLGYLQSIDEVKTYLMNVGREILPSGAPQFEFCQSLLKFPREAESSTSSPDPKPQEKRTRCPSATQSLDKAGRKQSVLNSSTHYSYGQG